MLLSEKGQVFGILFTLETSNLGSEPGKTRFTIFIRIIYITQLGHPIIRYFELPLSEQLIERM